MEKISTMNIKYLLFLLLGLSLLSCSDQKEVTVEQIKKDIFGVTIDGKYGAYYFNDPTSFISVRIVDQKRTDEILMVDTEFILEGDQGNQNFYYLRAMLEFMLINRKWRFVEGKQIKYLRDYGSKSFPD